MAANVDPVYEDYNPSITWEHEPELYILLVDLPPGFTGNLKLQVTPERILRIRGQQQLPGKKWTRIRKECTIPSDSDINKITAKREDGKLCVKLPTTRILYKELLQSFTISRLTNDLFGKLKQPGRLLKLVLVVLVALILGLCIKNWHPLH